VKERVRSERFADHYSQARQFFVSQSPTEQTHIVNGFVFELSKVEDPAIRTRMVANLRNVDDAFAQTIADKLGLALPPASAPASQPITDLPASPALSILANGPETFAGRKVGALVTDGTDAAVVAALRAAIEAEGAVLELIAPRIGGVTLSDGSPVPANQNIDGGPSVLYDAVAVLTSTDGAAALAGDAAAKDFVTDAHAHCKFVAYTASSKSLFEQAGIADQMDDGYVQITNKRASAEGFLATCADLRFWDREPATRWAIPIN
jgi:catalase